MTACTHHPSATVHHLGVRIGWKERRVWVDHYCEGGHDWSEEARDADAVLAKVGLCRIKEVADRAE